MALECPEESDRSGFLAAFRRMGRGIRSPSRREAPLPGVRDALLPPGGGSSTPRGAERLRFCHPRSRPSVPSHREGRSPNRRAHAPRKNKREALPLSPRMLSGASECPAPGGHAAIPHTGRGGLPPATRAVLRIYWEVRYRSPRVPIRPGERAARSSPAFTAHAPRPIVRWVRYGKSIDHTGNLSVY